MKDNTHKKTINGYICVCLRTPIAFEVDAEDVTYLEDGIPYTEEEYEYDVDQALEQNPNLRDMINNMKYKWNVEEITIEEN